MSLLSRVVVARRWWVIGVWLLLAVFGAVAAPPATDRLTFDFGLPGQPGYEANLDILQTVGSGGDFAPVLLVVGDGEQTVDPTGAASIAEAVTGALPGSRVATYADQPDLLSDDDTTGGTRRRTQHRPGHGAGRGPHRPSGQQRHADPVPGLRLAEPDPAAAQTAQTTSQVRPSGYVRLLPVRAICRRCVTGQVVGGLP